MFKIQDIDAINIHDLQRVLVFTCRDESEPIEFRHLECGEISEALTKKNAVPFREVGPFFTMRLRRDKMATIDLFKEACRKPKVANAIKKKSDKNKYTDDMGQQHGKVFVQQQDIKGLTLKKFGRKNSGKDGKDGKDEPGVPDGITKAEDV